MIVSHRHGFIFLRTRKTAGTSIEISLSRFCGPEDIASRENQDTELRREFGGSEAQNDVVPIRAWRAHEVRKLLRTRQRPRAFDHMPARHIRRMIGGATFDHYAKVTVIRNPFDAAISYYWWRHRRVAPEARPSISEFLAGPKMTPLTRNWDVYTLHDRVVADVVIRYENLAGDLDAAAARLGLPDLRLPDAKGGLRKDRRDPREVLSDADIATIRRRFAREIETFGYSV